MAVSHKVAIKGKYDDDGVVKNVTIATLTGVDITGEEGATFEDVQEAAAGLAQVVQNCISATVTGYTITYDGNDGASRGTPGDVLEPSEIFSEDFSDTDVIPTLQITNVNQYGASKSFSFKYMADPIDTPNFDANVRVLATEMAAFSFGTNGTYDNLVKGIMTFTAKDTVVEAT